MKKRTESSLVTACLQYLQTLENNKRIRWCDRLNSGKVFTGKRLIRLCRTGTPDIFVIRNDGSIIWLECKTKTGRQTIEQLIFSQMVDGLQRHQYHIIKNLDEIVKMFL